MTDAASFQPDVTLLIDLDGVIRETAVSPAFPERNLSAWLGTAWPDTLGGISADSASRMINSAKSTGACTLRHALQSFPSGYKTPMEYTIVDLGGDFGFRAIGRNLQPAADLQSRLATTQQALEHEYAKLRKAEARCRLVLQASNAPLALVDSTNLSVIEANRAAVLALGVTPQKSGRGGDSLLRLELVPQEREQLLETFTRAREHGDAPATLLHVGPDRLPWMGQASPISIDVEPVFLLQLTPVGKASESVPMRGFIPLDLLLDRMPDGLIVVDHDGVIRHVNQAFLALVEVVGKSRVVGERIGRWLCNPGADWQVLLANIRRHGVVRLFTTTMQSEAGNDTQVEISGIADTCSEKRHIGLMIRVVERRQPNTPENKGLRFGLDSITDKIGKLPLRSLVKETVGVVERHYVSEALDLADGNRTVAAELLGLSRQSLYAKLRLYSFAS